MSDNENFKGIRPNVQEEIIRELRINNDFLKEIVRSLRVVEHCQNWQATAQQSSGRPSVEIIQKIQAERQKQKELAQIEFEKKEKAIKEQHELDLNNQAAICNQILKKQFEVDGH